MNTAKPLNENQIRLLNRCPDWGSFRPGSVRCLGYKHAIGANNGLMGLHRAGLVSLYWDNGNVFRLTDAGRAANLPKPQSVTSS